MQSILICRVEKLYLQLCWCLHICHNTMCEHCTLPGTIICANFWFHFVNLTLATLLKTGAQSFGVRYQISHPTFSVFHDCCCNLKYIQLLLHFGIFHAFTLQGIASSRLLHSMYRSNEFWTEVPRASSINQASTIAPTFVKKIFATTCSMHTATFKQHLLNHFCTICLHACSCILSEQHSCCLFEATAPT